MAAVNDCFSVGSIVQCTTCFNQEVEGEVHAFDQNSKMLILKCPSQTSNELNDVFIVNLSLCSNVQVIKECNGNYVREPPKLNLEQLRIRVRNTVQQRRTFLTSQNADVSPEAQELYRVIAKQFKYNEVSWQGTNIQIFNEVTVMPPYRVENVITTSNNKTLCNYIKKLIEQFINTRGSQDNNSGTAGTSSASSPTPSSLSSSNAASNSPVPAN